MTKLEDSIGEIRDLNIPEYISAYEPKKKEQVAATQDPHRTNDPNHVSVQGLA